LGIKVFNAEGEVTGEKRFLGLFTASAYNESGVARSIIDTKGSSGSGHQRFTADSHSGRDLLEILETYPRDELFQTSAEDLYEIATTVLHLQERRKSQLFLRAADSYGRFVSCLIYIPRDRYTTCGPPEDGGDPAQRLPRVERGLTRPRVSESVLCSPSLRGSSRSGRG